MINAFIYRKIPNLLRTIVTDSDKKTKYLTLGQAAKETGRSKSTIFKAIQNGTLSYMEKTSAGYKLDRDEVFYCFLRTI
jgi:hypothetical protein